MSGEDSLSGLWMAAFLLCLHMANPRFMYPHTHTQGERGREEERERVGEREGEGEGEGVRERTSFLWCLFL